MYISIYIYGYWSAYPYIYTHIKTLRYMDGYAVAWIYRYIDMKIHWPIDVWIMDTSWVCQAPRIREWPPLSIALSARSCPWAVGRHDSNPIILVSIPSHSTYSCSLRLPFLSYTLGWSRLGCASSVLFRELTLKAHLGVGYVYSWERVNMNTRTYGYMHR